MKKLFQIITVALGLFMILKGTANAGDASEKLQLHEAGLEEKLVLLISHLE